jgi:uncharacterized protein (TIGR02646 family)
MIFVTRVAKPKVLQEKDVEWKKQIAAATTDTARKAAQNKYRNKQIKDALIKMFSGKCAYCESFILHVDYGDIEHFRPKALPQFYTQAVEWTNLLLACGRCNGAEHKGVKFPGVAEGGPLIDPTADLPDQHFRFDFDQMTKLANVLGVSQRGQTSETTFGLNRPLLVRQRSKFVKKLWAIAPHYNYDAEARQIIDESVKSTEEYAAFARELKQQLDSGVLFP